MFCSCPSFLHPDSNLPDDRAAPPQKYIKGLAEVAELVKFTHFTYPSLKFYRGGVKLKSAIFGFHFRSYATLRHYGFEREQNSQNLKHQLKCRCLVFVLT